MGVFCDRLNFVSTAPPTAVLAKTKADIEKRALIPTHLVLPNVKTRVHCTFRWPKSIIFLDNFMHITNTVLSRHEFSTNDYG